MALRQWSLLLCGGVLCAVAAQATPARAAAKPTARERNPLGLPITTLRPSLPLGSGTIVSGVSGSVVPDIAGASQAQYTFLFTTSSEGALAAGVDQVQIEVPGSGGCPGGTLQITDLTTHRTGTAFCAASPPYIAFTTPIDIGDGDEVQVVTAQTYTVTSSIAPQTITISTSLDGAGTGPMPAAAPPLPVSGVSGSVVPDIAGASQAQYTFLFTASSQGALAAGVDQVQIEVPGSGGCPGGTLQVTDLTTHLTASAVCESSPPYIAFTTPLNIGDGDEVQVVTAQTYTVTSSIAPQTITISTSLDGAGTGPMPAAAPPLPVSGVSGSVVPNIAGASQAQYTFLFTASSQGALAAGVDRVQIEVPGSGGCPGGTLQVTDLTTHLTASAVCESSPPYIAFTTPLNIGDGDEVQVVTAQTYTVTSSIAPQTITISTSLDGAGTGPMPAAAPPLPVTGISASVTPNIAGASAAQYTFLFTASSQGALAAGVDQVQIEVPGSGGCPGGTLQVTDLTTHLTASAVCESSPPYIAFTTPLNIGDNDDVEVQTADTYTAPAGSGVHDVSVSTSLDATGATTYSLGSGSPVSSLSASVSPGIAGATDATYTIGFTTSLQGALAAGTGTITVALPGASGCSTETIDDLTSKQSANVTCALGSPVPTPIAIVGGDQVAVTIAGVTAPATAGSQTATVWTSVDSQASTSYPLGAGASSLSGLAASVTPAVAGATEAVYRTTFSVSSQGALAAGGGTVTVALPGASGCSTETIDDLTSRQSADVACALGSPVTTPIPIANGDQITITITGVTTPTSAGEQAATVSTSQDGATVASYMLDGSSAVPRAAVSLSSSTASGAGVDYAVDLTTSPAGALAAGYGRVELSFPGGTGLPSCESIVLTDLGSSTSGLPTACAISGTHVSLTVPFDVSGGDRLTVAISDVTNSATAGVETLGVATTTDGTVDASFTLTSAATATTTTTATSTTDTSTASSTVPPPGYRTDAVSGPTSGTVRVELPGTKTFVALAQGAQVPLGSTVNATNGSVELVFARPGGGTMDAVFSGGEFIPTQSSGGEVIAALTGGSFASCPASPTSKLASIASRKPIRKLWASDNGGDFGTRGKYVATTVEGTMWLTEDFCGASEVDVTHGRVRATSLVTHRSRTLRAGQSYTVTTSAKKHKSGKRR